MNFCPRQVWIYYQLTIVHSIFLDIQMSSLFFHITTSFDTICCECVADRNSFCSPSIGYWILGSLPIWLGNSVPQNQECEISSNNQLILLCFNLSTYLSHYATLCSLCRFSWFQNKLLQVCGSSMARTDHNHFFEF